MAGLEHIPHIIARIKQRGLLQSIVRHRSFPVDVDQALELLTELGRQMNIRFRIDDENRFTYENLVYWIHADSRMQAIDSKSKQPVVGVLNRGIYIAGNTGTGKSWALDLIVAYSMIYNFQIRINDENYCLNWHNFRADSICDVYIHDGTIARFKKKAILGIQDLGAEPEEALYMGNRANVLRMLLEYRGDRSDMITLITSNLPMGHKALINKYGDRVSSRLQEMCNYFEIRGKDRRERE